MWTKQTVLAGVVVGSLTAGAILAVVQLMPSGEEDRSRAVAPVPTSAPAEPSADATGEAPLDVETTTVFLTPSARTVTTRVTERITVTVRPSATRLPPVFFADCKALRSVLPNDTVVGDHPAYRGELDSDSNGVACDEG